MERRFFPILGSAVFLFIAPGTLAGLIPWWISHWRMQEALVRLQALRWVGAGLILAGVVAIIECFARFAWQGLGTPAPVFPTKRLIVMGLYRHVRNPMYCAVTGIILGQGLLLGDAWLIGYGAAVWMAVHLFVLTYEEPTLRRTYGADYEAFRAGVPRWMPRLRPWRGSTTSPQVILDSTNQP
jgi:protein-S-isoprenylcysteine O-methyltransferase Ste14